MNLKTIPVTINKKEHMTLSETSQADSAGHEHLRPALSTSHLHPSNVQFFDWMEARANFMSQKGWVDVSSGDFDRYDDDMRTDHVMVSDERGELLYGMRLTPVESLEESLSWEMIDHSTMDKAAMQKAWPFEGREVWDLTRLVPLKRSAVVVANAAIPALFGEGLRECVRKGDADPVWLFVMDSKFRHWLEKQGVFIEELGAGRINGDEDESTIGYFEPAKLAALGYQHSFSYWAMGDKT